jgi:hypothetical protein
VSEKITTFLDGVDRLARAVLMADQHVREQMRGAVERGTQAVTNKAHARVKKRTGELDSTIRAEFSKDHLTGFVRVGYGTLVRRGRAKTDKAQLAAERRKRVQRSQKILSHRFRGAGIGSAAALKQLDLGVYAPVVEYSRKKGRPFLNPALRLEKPGIIADMNRALTSGTRGIGDGL